jgi:hypothetical protein
MAYPRKQCYSALLATCFQADFMLGLFREPEDGGVCSSET